MPVCAAYGCHNRPDRDRDKSYHKFPWNNRSLFKRWLINLRREKYTPSKQSVVCSDHFEDSQLDRTGQITRLRMNAAPTIFKAFPSHLIKDTGITKVLCKKCQTNWVVMTMWACGPLQATVCWTKLSPSLQSRTTPRTSSRNGLYTKRNGLDHQILGSLASAGHEVPSHSLRQPWTHQATEKEGAMEMNHPKNLKRKPVTQEPRKGGVGLELYGPGSGEIGRTGGTSIVLRDNTMQAKFRLLTIA
ncbi:uncharacterized protein [Procambarus clarkii]|uniref:uncharacterized protein isoform X2 n=1 Tax=Procambarus clarkii TaxID=6728 RepID=UPI003744B0CE